jgi:glycosyltransferase involved in cell wall biosynthesis
VQKQLAENPGLRQKVRLLPACNPDTVWEYLCAADIFAFTSHREGMPNSLLEAMVMKVPAVAFAIPPVSEIEAGTGALLLVPPFNIDLFAAALVNLAASPESRARLGEKGKDQVMDRFMVWKNMILVRDQLAEVVKSRCPHRSE